ncbi:MAG: peptide chain release factor-like protein [Gemmataceae bacterium]|jgi:hypothetical protein|uniref:Peptide chain release factor-like protein n=1 Tax=Thermogemmata fonticola TaxID=2755323 RepID=A0A7V9AAG5_9BACT|nr:peptide chain release factor-like protein [Thermogemmata fonticola]MBA2225018.1 peptide chain release factor-like protein [Thermogemmata fonticola]MCX8140634.1 peptide chain release factor-like protein [Gemmataceae bacterium]
MSEVQSQVAQGGGPTFARRSPWTALSDEQLLAQCSVDTYRASGPGGQKRNKTSSAVRLRHHPSGLIVIAEESRSQHENKARALQRLRQGFYLHIREAIPAAADGKVVIEPVVWQQLGLQPGEFPRSVKHPAFWPLAGLALDVLAALQGRVAPAAEALGVSTAQLVHFLQRHPQVWQQVNRLRQHFGHAPLH